MTSVLKFQRTPRILSEWRQNKNRILGWAVALMIIAATVWLSYETFRYFAQPSGLGSCRIHPGAIDIKKRYQEQNAWFRGDPVYGAAPYPPASYVLFRSLIGWFSEPVAVLVWGVMMFAMLGWLVLLTIRETGAQTRRESFFAGMLPLSMYATGACIGNGQVTLHLIPSLITALLLLDEGGQQWGKRLGGILLMTGVLMKPSVSAPFFWIVLFRSRGGLLSGLFVVAGYGILTILAAQFQPDTAANLLRQWAVHGVHSASFDAMPWSHANLHTWSAALGLQEWNATLSLAVLSALGIWVWMHRGASCWVLIGVTALVARFWTYHGWYDDLLILLPMIALFRICKTVSVPERHKLLAGLLLGAALLSTIAPGGLYLLPQAWKMLYTSAQSVLWAVILVFLAWHARLRQCR